VQALAAAVNVRLELQRDPRGWPLILQLAGHVYRLEG
jgi:hypothetical protein